MLFINLTHDCADTFFPLGNELALELRRPWAHTL